jgi:hypothetical protein
MAQIFWEQIKDALPLEGKFLTGSLSTSGSLGVTGSIYYNGQLLETFITSQLVTGSNNWNTIVNKPANLFSGSFIAGTNISISQVGQNVTISAAQSLLPPGTVSGSSQINFLGISNIPVGLVSSSAQILPITTASIVDFKTNVENVMGRAYVESVVDGNLLLFTRQDGTGDYVDLGLIVPSTPTGSLVYSGSFSNTSTLLTLYRTDGNINVDLSGLAGSINDGDVTAVFAGTGLIGGGENGDLTISANTSTTYGTEIVNDFIGIATGSFKFVDAVYKSGIFRQTGSFWNTTNNIGITGSLNVALDGSTTEISVAVSGTQKIKVNTEGVLQMISQSVTPTAVEGGIFYSSSDAFYLGFQN